MQQDAGDVEYRILGNHRQFTCGKVESHQTGGVGIARIPQEQRGAAVSECQRAARRSVVRRPRAERGPLGSAVLTHHQRVGTITRGGPRGAHHKLAVRDPLHDVSRVLGHELKAVRH